MNALRWAKVAGSLATSVDDELLQHDAWIDEPELEHMRAGTRELMSRCQHANVVGHRSVPAGGGGIGRDVHELRNLVVERHRVANGGPCTGEIESGRDVR